VSAPDVYPPEVDRKEENASHTKRPLDRAMAVVGGFALGFAFGWGAAIQFLSQFVTEPWAWFWVLERPDTALVWGLVFGIVGALLGLKRGLGPLAPLAVAIPVALPFMPAWIPFFRVYQAVAIDLGMPILALSFFATLVNLLPPRPWSVLNHEMDSPRAAKMFSWGLPLLFAALSSGAFMTGEKIMRGAGFTGDSPQYVLIADALVIDHSLDLMPAIMREDHINWIEEPVGGHGETYNLTEHYSKYKSGYSVAIAPFVAMGWLTGGDFRLWSIFGTLLFGMAVTWNLFRLLHSDLRLPPSTAAMGVVGVMITFPMLAFGVQVYPEMLAALMVTLGLRFLINAEKSGAWAAIGMGAAMGMLLFLHDRFGFFGLPAIVAYFWLTRKSAWRVWPVFLGTLTLFAGIVLIDLYIRHFDVIPRTGQYGRAGQYWNPLGVYIGWIGGLLDKGHGALIYAPVFLMAPAGIIFAVRARPWPSWPLLVLMAIPYFLVLGFDEWWAGTSPPGTRYIVAYYPALAVFLGFFWNSRPAAWVYWLFFWLIGVGLAITRNFFTYADEYYLVHQCYLDRRLLTLDPSRIFFDFTQDTDLAAKTAAWLVVTAVLTAIWLKWRDREVEPTRFSFSLVAALFLLIGAFYTVFPEKSHVFAQRQKGSFELSNQTGWTLWSASQRQMEAEIPSRFLPVVPFDEPEGEWVRLAPGVTRNGLTIFGRYLKLPPGKYKIEIPIRVPEGSEGDTGFIEVVEVQEKTEPYPKKTFLLAEGAVAEFTIDRPMLNVEARLRLDNKTPVEIGPMRITGATSLTRSQP